ncbi:MAG: PD-(D/E)XK nuclease superfamily protein [Desulfobaccales bacterium]
MARKPSLSSGITSSGEKANKTGNLLERFVEQILRDKGYTEFWDHKLTAFENRWAIGGRQYIKQLPVGQTIYETTRKCDFFIINRDLFPEDLIIECKWQQVTGSVDEKYPFLLFNIVKTGIPTIILLDGSGYKKSAMKWLKNQVHEKGALIAVWNMAEFQTKVNNKYFG